MGQSRGYDGRKSRTDTRSAAAGALRTAIALATVATDADCERRPAGHMGAKPKAQNSVRVDLHMSHFEIMSPEPDGGPGWLRVSPVGGDY